jgi:hypothetical protein
MFSFVFLVVSYSAQGLFGLYTILHYMLVLVGKGIYFEQYAIFGKSVIHRYPTPSEQNIHQMGRLPPLPVRGPLYTLPYSVSCMYSQYHIQ